MEYPQVCVAQVFAYNTEQQDSQQIMILIRFVFCSYDFILIFKPMPMFRVKYRLRFDWRIYTIDILLWGNFKCLVYL